MSKTNESVKGAEIYETSGLLEYKFVITRNEPAMEGLERKRRRSFVDGPIPDWKNSSFIGILFVMFSILTDRWFDGERFCYDTVRMDIAGETITRIKPVDSELSAVAIEPCPSHLLDARGTTVIPGLINTHTHIARGGMFRADESFSPVQVVQNLENALCAGVTTVGDMGGVTGLSRALREHFERHPTAGPSVKAGGPLLTVSGGYPLDWLPPLSALLGAALPCSDGQDARHAVRHVHRMGMDFIKLAIMHQSYAEKPISVIREETATELIAEARALDLNVLCHAHYLADYKMALRLGVDALMHSCFEPLDAETVARIRDSGIPVCPTLWVFESAVMGVENRLDRDPRYTRYVSSGIRNDWKRFCDAYETSGDVLPPVTVAAGLPKARAMDAIRTAPENLMMLRDAGVPIVFGSDSPYGFSLLNRPTDELQAMERAGMNQAECLQAATSRAAELLGLNDRGRLEPGKRADIVILEGDAGGGLNAVDQILEVIVAGNKLGNLPFWKKAANRAGTGKAILQGVASTGVDAIRYRA